MDLSIRNELGMFLVDKGNTGVFDRDVLKRYNHDLNKIYVELLIEETTCKK